jgi:cyclopropane-fatty-acyl-phospholipid synthase
MAASALGFEAGDIQVHQIIGVPAASGLSGMPLRPDWDAVPLNALPD